MIAAQTDRMSSRHRLGIVGAIMLAVFLLSFAVSAFFAFEFTGPQRRSVRPLPADFGFAVEAVNFAARDGLRLRGWFVPCDGSVRAAVLLHGNGSTRSQMIARARLLRTHGYAVLLYDARGHGESDGERVSFGLFETRDLLGALDYVRSRGASEIGCVGASQGGATIALAANDLQAVRWVVLESVFPDLTTALDRRFRHTLHLPGWFAGILMQPLAEWRIGASAREIEPRRLISRLQCPVLILGGEKDPYTTAADTRALYSAAPDRKQLWLVPDASHVDLYGAAGRAYERHLVDFLNDATGH
ncbi:MAG: alpha/beta fold hydrolase [Opitutae bacterium]|nr:alpha/beta fold hydrolase [Opitutae bacterium]